MFIYKNKPKKKKNFFFYNFQLSKFHQKNFCSMISIIDLLINIWNIYSIIVKKTKNQPNDLIHLMVMRFIKEKNKNIEVISKLKKKLK